MDVIFASFAQKTIILLIVFLIALCDHLSPPVCGQPSGQLANKLDQHQPRELRWPARQLNVLLDEKSLNQTERGLIGAFLGQIEEKTCVRVNRLDAAKVNPFDPNQHLYLDELERNYIYVFKSQFGTHSHAHQSIGLSTLGCAKQGRQSVVLTNLAFNWPQLVLRYHILRSLGLQNLNKPDKQLDRLLKEFPLNQKIASEEPVASEPSESDPAPSLFAFARRPSLASANRAYLDAQDIFLLKQLYGCPDYQNKLSPAAHHGNERGGSPNVPAKQDGTSLNKLEPTGQIVEPALGGRRPKIESSTSASDALSSSAAKSIVDDLLASNDNDADDGADHHGAKNEETSADAQETTTPSDQTTTIELPEFNNELDDHADQCKPLDACPIEPRQKRRLERPMLLKLDLASSQDPHLNQANQMKLSQMNNDSLATYRLLEAPASLAQPAGHSEMLLSFEQQGDATSPLLGGPGKPQVLKLCSCTCQTMVPADQVKPTTVEPTQTSTASSSVSPFEPTTTTTGTLPSRTQTPTTEPSVAPTTELTTELSSSPTSEPPTEPLTSTSSSSWSEQWTGTEWPASTVTPTDFSEPPSPSTSGPPPPPTTMQVTTEPTTNTMTTTTALPTSSDAGEKPTSVAPTITTGGGGGGGELNWTTSTPLPDELSEPTELTSTTAANGGAACDQVQWVRPNKSVYSSARIVWDMDRANQNYFICQNELNKELVPGKTHGFSCKVSQQGKAYELHQFKVLTKPESVNLAWIQRNSDTFGKSNLPVVGGYSASGDPYIVGRCMVRDENNDVITLIGYVNTLGSGWFPFDDIQIECDQYDVLACVT